MTTCEDKGFENEPEKYETSEIHAVNCGTKGWQSGATENHLIVSVNGNSKTTRSIQQTKQESLIVSYNKNCNSKKIEANHNSDCSENSEQSTDKDSEATVTSDNSTDDIHASMNSLNKHSITDQDTATNPPNKKFKQESITEYNVENYISQKQIDEIVKKCESYSVEKRTCAVFDLNTISTTSHNIVINPESGEVESIIRKEYDKSTTPQSFFICPQNNSSLDIIQEEPDNDSLSSDSERSSIRRCSISTQTDFESETTEEKEETSLCKLKKSQTLTSNLNTHVLLDAKSILNNSPESNDEVKEKRNQDLSLVTENNPPDSTFDEFSTLPNVMRTISLISNQYKDHTRIDEQKIKSTEDQITDIVKHSNIHSESNPVNYDFKYGSLDRDPNLKISNEIPTYKVARKLERDKFTNKDHHSVACDKCGNAVNLKDDNVYSSTDSLHNSNRNSLQSLSNFTFYPVNQSKSGVSNFTSSSSPKRNSTISSNDRNSTYSMSSESMSIALNYDSSYSSLNRNKSSSSGALSRNSPYGTISRQYPAHELKRMVPVRHSSYNALNRLSQYSSLSSSSSYSTLSRDSVDSSRVSLNSTYGTLSQTSTMDTNSDKMALYSLPNKPRRSEVDARLSTLKRDLQKCSATSGMYRGTSSTSDTSNEDIRRRQSRYSSSTGNSITDEVTHSLNELSKKYDAYIKNKEYVESSSDTNTDSTVRYVPEDMEGIKSPDEPEYVYVSSDRVPTLKKLSLKAVLAAQNGIDMLSNIYFVPPQKSTHLNKLVKGAKCCQCVQHASLLQPRKKIKQVKLDTNLYEMHRKFTERRGYFDSQRSEPKRELIIEDIYSPRTPRSCILNVDENYTKELLEEAATLLALRKYRETRIRSTVNRHYIDQNFDLITYKVRTPNLSSRSNQRVNKDQTCRNNSRADRVLESVQNKARFTATQINQIDNNVKSQSRVQVNTNRSRSFTSNGIAFVQKSHSTANVIGRREPSQNRSQSLPPDSAADIRQVMYTEYMKKVAERLERKQKKIIKITSRTENGPTMVKIFNDVSKEKPCTLEEEFMRKARTRLHKLGYDLEDSSCENTEEESTSSSRQHDELPSHLREFVQFSDQEISNEEGVWSPGQTRKLERRSSDAGDQKEPKNDSGSSTPVVWSPRSAPSSPTNERKSYRPVRFESPTLSRKNATARSTVTEQNSNDSNLKKSTSSNTVITTVSKKKNAHSQTPERSNGYENSEKEKSQRVEESTETVTSNHYINTGISNGVNTTFSPTTSKLPRAQNPTITLLQKAREGQLPRGALYLDHIMNEKETRETNKRNIEPNEIVYNTVQRQYEQNENENSKRPKKMSQLSGRKIDGIGPTTKEGIPTVLRSELRDADHQKWYKQMYESLHKAYDDHDFVTVRYKTRARDRGYVHSGGGYQSEPEQFGGYNSDFDASRYTAHEERNGKNKENQFTFGTVPRSSSSSAIKHAANVYKNQPGRIENYEPGHSSIAQKETKRWWDEVMDIFDDNLVDKSYSSTSQRKPFSSLHGSGYESDSTLVFKRREDNQQQAMSPAEQRSVYKSIQKGGEVPLHGLRKPAPEKPKEPVTRTHDSFHSLSPTTGGMNEHRFDNYESPHKYAESEVTLQYKIPIRNEIKEAWSEEELNRRQAETMRRIYQEERRRKYLQELQDMSNRRHTDNLLPSQKSPIPLNRYDDVLEEPVPQRSRSRTPEPKLVARALYHFTGQTSRELTFRKGDIIFVKRQIDKNWYEGEHNAMIGLFPINYVEIIPYDEIRTLPKRASEGQARARFNFVAQTNLELSLVKGELIVLTRRVDDNWYEGRIGNRRGIFPVSYVNVIREPGEYGGAPDSSETSHNNRKPVASPAAHSLITNQQSLPSQHNYQPNSYTTPITLPRTTTRSQRDSSTLPLNETLHIDTSSEPVPYRALYNYKPQNEDELELREGETVYVMEKCDDGWYVGSSQRTSHFGTFPGNYVERIS